MDETITVGRLSVPDASPRSLHQLRAFPSFTRGLLSQRLRKVCQYDGDDDCFGMERGLVAIEGLLGLPCQSELGGLEGRVALKRVNSEWRALQVVYSV